jgi:peptide/nickel transport system substrate-binding protein
VFAHYQFEDYVKRLKWIRPSGVIAASVLIALAACSSEGGDAGSEAPAETGSVGVADKAVGGLDKLTWALPYGEPTSLDPIKASDYSPSFVASQMCDSLLRMKSDFSVEPNLAESKQVSDTELEYTIRDDAKFWDGGAVTAEDVVYSLERARGPESYVAFIFANVESIKATGTRTVQVVFKQPDVLFNSQMATFAGMVMEKKYTEAKGADVGTPSGGVMCSGAFKLDSWEPGNSINLVANPDYWNTALRPKAKTVTLTFISDSTALATALKSGEVDGAYEIPASLTKTLQSADRGTLQLGDSMQSSMIYVARPDGPLADVNVRKALMLSLDREAIGKVIYNGTADPNYTLLSSASWNDDTQEAWRAAYEPFKKENAYSLDEAKKALSGSTVTDPIVVAVLAGDTTQQRMAVLLQENAKTLGLTVKIKALQPLPYSGLFAEASNRDGIDMFISATFNTVRDPLLPIQFYVLNGSPFNYTNYSDKQVQDLIDQARQTFDTAKRTDLVTQAQTIYEKSYLATTIVNQKEVSFISNKIAGAERGLSYLFTPSLASIGSAK